MNNIYIRHTDDLWWMQSCVAGYVLTYLSTPTRQLDTWTVLGLTASYHLVHCREANRKVNTS
jgi:hypothetical protein